MQALKTDDNIHIERPRNILSIFEGEPRDVELQEAPEPNPKDFEQDITKDLEPDEKMQEVEEPEVETVSDDDLRKEQLNKKAAEIKKDFVKLVKPSNIIMFLDMGTSRIGPMIAVRSSRDDWKLDAEEKQWLADILDAVIEEEGIDHWPAKYWLIIGVVFIYGMKTWDVTGKYYTQKGVEQREPQLYLEEIKAKKEAHEAKLEAIRLESQMYKEESELLAELKRAKAAVDKGVTVDDVKREEFHEKQDKYPTAQGTKRKKSRRGHYTVNSYGEVFDHHDYPRDIFSYENGLLVLKKDGKPARKRGKPNLHNKYRHPITKAFMTKEDWLAEFGTFGDPDEQQEMENQENDIEDADIVSETKTEEHEHA